MRSLYEVLEVGVVAVCFLFVVGLAVWVGYMHLLPIPANGHPPEDCPKVEQAHPRSHFLSTPKISVPSKADRVKLFQKRNGLKVDGVIGKETKRTCFGQCWGAND